MEEPWWLIQRNNCIRFWRRSRSAAGCQCERLHEPLGLIESANQETAHLVGLAILEIRMKLNRISDSDLKALCDAMLADQSPAEASQDLKALHRQRWRPVLKVIK